MRFDFVIWFLRRFAHSGKVFSEQLKQVIKASKLLSSFCLVSGNAQDLSQHIYCDREVLESRGALENTKCKD